MYSKNMIRKERVFAYAVMCCHLECLTAVFLRCACNFTPAGRWGECRSLSLKQLIAELWRYRGGVGLFWGASWQAGGACSLAGDEKPGGISFHPRLASLRDPRAVSSTS